MLTLAAAWFSPLLMAAGLLITLGAFVLRWFLLGRDWVWAYLDKDESIIVGGCSDTFANAIEAWRPVVRTS